MPWFAALAAILFASCQTSPPEPEPGPTFTQVREIAVQDLREWEAMGRSVAFDGSRLLAGTYAGQYNPLGRAFLFEKDEGGTDAWGEVKRFEPGGAYVFDQLGYAVALEGETAFIGAPQESDVETTVGAVYLFSRDQGGAGAWGEMKRLTLADGNPSDYFGQALSADGDTLLVGAPGNSSAVEGGGAVHIFVRDQGGPENWGETAKILPSDPRLAARFGTAVALDGDVAVIGAPKDGVPGALYGAAYVFSRTGGTQGAWTEVKKLSADDPADWDLFGGTVAVSGDLIIVGTPGKMNAGGVSKGAAYLFGRDRGGPDNWGLVRKLTAVQGDGFGTAVSLSAEYALVGAPGARASPTIMGGAVYVFARDQGGTDTWGLQARLNPAGPPAYCQFGSSIALAGNLFAVGGPSWDFSRGAVFIFRIDP